VRVDPERNLILVKGAVPGARNALLLVQKAK
jgi:ribosomal protein L3